MLTKKTIWRNIHYVLRIKYNKFKWRLSLLPNKSGMPSDDLFEIDYSSRFKWSNQKFLGM